MRYLVVIDGAGELEDDFSVMVVEADKAIAAVDRVVADGYGKDRDSVAYVAPLDDVSVFVTNPSTKRVVQSATFEEVVEQTAPSLRKYLDPDGGHE